MKKFNQYKITIEEFKNLKNKNGDTLDNKAEVKARVSRPIAENLQKRVYQYSAWNDGVGYLLKLGILINPNFKDKEETIFALIDEGESQKILTYPRGCQMYREFVDWKEFVETGDMNFVYQKNATNEVVRRVQQKLSYSLRELLGIKEEDWDVWVLRPETFRYDKHEEEIVFFYKDEKKTIYNGYENATHYPQRFVEEILQLIEFVKDFNKFEIFYNQIPERKGQWGGSSRGFGGLSILSIEGKEYGFCQQTFSQYQSRVAGIHPGKSDKYTGYILQVTKPVEAKDPKSSWDYKLNGVDRTQRIIADAIEFFHSEKLNLLK